MFSVSNFLLLASELYSLPILRPLAAAAIRQGHRVAWLARDAVAAQLAEDEARIDNRIALQQFAADATFATVHRPPPQLPGRQVQLFHGLNLDKRDGDRGHFRIRGLFDLYCTHGPATTARFLALAREHAHFAVAETGWPKLDPLFVPDAGADVFADSVHAAAGDRPVVLYASTFTEGLSSASAFLPEARRLVARGDRYWLLTLHPKSAPHLVDAYRSLAGANARFVEATELVPALHAAGALVCDTSSVTEEFALMDKPIVTIHTRLPRAFMLDVASPDEVDAALEVARTRDPARMQAMRDYAQALHPSRDGHASERVLAATLRLLQGGDAALAPRPHSRWRAFKARDELRALLPRG